MSTLLELQVELHSKDSHARRRVFGYFPELYARPEVVFLARCGEVNELILLRCKSNTVAPSPALTLFMSGAEPGTVLLYRVAISKKVKVVDKPY